MKHVNDRVVCKTSEATRYSASIACNFIAECAWIRVSTDSYGRGGDPALERQVATIRNLVESYMNIVIKTTKDLVPKIVVHMIINDLKVDERIRATAKLFLI